MHVFDFLLFFVNFYYGTSSLMMMLAHVCPCVCQESRHSSRRTVDDVVSARWDSAGNIYLLTAERCGQLCACLPDVPPRCYGRHSLLVTDHSFTHSLTQIIGLFRSVSLSVCQSLCLLYYCVAVLIKFYFDFTFNRSFMKLLRTNNIETVKVCQFFFLVYLFQALCCAVGQTGSNRNLVFVLT